jgi:ribokinase
VAVAAARLLGPGRVALIGALGDDEVAGMQSVELRGEGVSTEGLAVLKGRRSGRAYIIVDGEGRKTIHTHFGANEEIQPTHLSGRGASGAISRSSMVVVMDAPTPVGARAARMAAERKARVIYSPGVRAAEGLQSLDETIRLSEALVLDSNELKNVCGTGDVYAAIEKLRRRFPEVTVVATLGQAGCVVARDGVTSRIEGVSLAKLGLRAVNSTGSGDAFLGAFASYLLMGRSPTEAVSWANLAGALKATRYETRGSPSRRELESRMRSLEALRRLPRGSQGKRGA